MALIVQRIPNLGYYWSSTTAERYIGRDVALTVDVSYGRVAPIAKVGGALSQFLFVRAVRGGISIPKK